MKKQITALENKLLYLIDKYSFLIFYLLLIALSLQTRVYLFPMESVDFTDYLNPWLDKIRAFGFAGFGERFSNYSSPYLILLYLFTFTDLSNIQIIKITSVLFDYVLAAYVALCVFQLTKNRIAQAASAAIVLFLPTVILNGSAWGQCDVIFTCFSVMSFYYILKEKHKTGIFCYAMSFAFKFQAVFIFPVFILLVVWKTIPLRYLLIIPICFMVWHLPFVMVGAPIQEVFFGVYEQQAGTYKELTLSAPSLWQFVPDNPLLRKAAPHVAFCILLTVCFVFYKIRNSRPLHLLLSFMTFFSLLAPLVLPRMHERYFFLADIFAVLYAFSYPRFFFVPMLTICASLLAYMPFLFKTTVVDLKIASVLILLSTVCVGIKLFRELLSADTGDSAQQNCF